MYCLEKDKAFGTCSSCQVWTPVQDLFRGKLAQCCGEIADLKLREFGMLVKMFDLITVSTSVVRLPKSSSLLLRAHNFAAIVGENQVCSLLPARQSLNEKIASAAKCALPHSFSHFGRTQECNLHQNDYK